jgi:hypothetical protein
LSYVWDEVDREEDGEGEGIVKSFEVEFVGGGVTTALELVDEVLVTVELDSVDEVIVETELELGDGMAVIVTWAGVTSMIEYPVVVMVAAGGVIVTRTVWTVPDS